MGARTTPVRGNRRTPARSLGRCLAVAALAALFLGGSAAGSAPAGAGRSGPVPPGRPAAIGPVPSESPNASRWTELDNLALANGTVRFGSSPGPNGWGLTALAYDGLDHRLFVGAADPSPAVLVVNAVENVVVAAWPLPGGASDVPRGLAFDPNGDRLVVAGGASDNVTIFDAADGAVLATTFVGVATDPVAVAVDPVDDRIGVAEPEADAVGILNASSGAVLGGVDVGLSPSALAFDPPLAGFVVADSGGASVSYVDDAAGTLGSTAPVGSDPDGVAFDPSGGLLLVSNGGSDNVSALDPLTLRQNTSYGTGADPVGLTVTTDGIAAVPNAADGNVTLFDDYTHGALPSLPARAGPVDAAWNAAEGHIYVADARAGAVTEIDPAGTAVSGTLWTGASPLAVVARGRSGELAAADGAEGTVERFDLGNGTLLGRTEAGGTPTSLAYDPAPDAYYATVANGTNRSLVAVNGSSGAVTWSAPMAAGATGAVYVAALGVLAVADAGAGQVELVDPLNGTVNATFAVPNGTGHPTADAVAYADQKLFVSAGTSNDSVAVLNASTGAPVASDPTPPGPTALVDVPPSGAVWVADTGADELTEISESSGAVVGNLTLPAAPAGLAFDASVGWLLVAEGTNGNVVIVDPVADRVLATVPAGTDPVALAVDPTTGDVAVADAGDGAIGRLGPAPERSPVVFQETGLPVPVPAWSVLVDGEWFGSNGSTVVAAEANGSHVFAVDALPGEVPFPSGGRFVVTGAPLNLSIAFGPPSYNVSFIETGLPQYSAWWVTVGAMNLSGTSSTLTAALPNGTYAFDTGTTAAYAPVARTGTGNVTVVGASPAPTVVEFSPLPPYVVTFTETGLPNGTRWSVLFGGAPETSNRSVLAFRTNAGDYAWSVAEAAGESPTPSSGAIAVGGGSSPAPIAIAFSAPPAPGYPVAFVATGLPAGGSITVSLGGAERSGPSPLIFDEPDGTYAYTVAGPAGTSASPSRGNVTVEGSGVIVSVTVTAAGTHVAPSWLGTLGPVGTGLLIGGLGAVVIAAVYLASRRRRRVLSGELVRKGAGASEPPDEPPADEE